IAITFFTRGDGDRPVCTACALIRCFMNEAPGNSGRISFYLYPLPRRLLNGYPEPAPYASGCGIKAPASDAAHRGDPDPTIHCPWEGNMRNKLIATLVALPLLVISMSAMAADPAVGRWKTYDEETGKPRLIVDVYEAKGGTIAAKVVDTL